MKKYKIGDVVECEVTGITNYGVFVKLGSEYTGLIHISEISNRFVNDIEKLYIMGEVIEAKILEIDETNKQIKLSIKQNEHFKDNLEIWVREKLKDLEKVSKKQ